MHRVMMDSETIGCDWVTLSNEERAYIIKYTDNHDEQLAQRELGLRGLTAELVAIGMLNPESGKGVVHGRLPGGHLLARSVTQHANIEIRSHPSERELLEAFWGDLDHFEQLITFNGRFFDGPLIMDRSLVLGVRIRRHLVPSRFSLEHIDLMDRLSYFGAIKARKLDFYCRRLGIPSPKHGVDGSMVEQLWHRGEYIKIFDYCADDVVAQVALLERAERVGLVPGH